MKISGIKIKPTSGRLKFSSAYVEPAGVRWLSPSDMGTFGEDEEIAIPLLYADPDDEVTDITITAGSLPVGIQLNPFDKEISGVITATETTVYNFTLGLHTGDGRVINREFFFTASITNLVVAWMTDGNLGEFDGGAGINLGLKAETAYQ